MRAALARAAACAGAACCGLAPAQPAAEQVRELRVVDGALPVGERLIAALKGDRLRWRITSNAGGELHLHAYRLIASVQPGQTAELAFAAHATGRFRLEWHPAGKASGGPGAHHAPALATLEVRPR